MDPHTGIVVSVASSAVDIVVATPPDVEFLTRTENAKYLFRVYEKFALRVRDADQPPFVGFTIPPAASGGPPPPPLGGPGGKASTRQRSSTSRAPGAAPAGGAPAHSQAGQETPSQPRSLEDLIQVASRARNEEAEILEALGVVSARITAKQVEELPLDDKERADAERELKALMAERDTLESQHDDAVQKTRQAEGAVEEEREKIRVDAMDR
jgi:hypothetical protein